MFNFTINSGFGGCGGAQGYGGFNPSFGMGMPFMGGMPGLNGMMAMGGMMQVMQGLMMMMGGELPGTGMMPGGGLMTAANPMFGGCCGPQASIGMQDFLGDPGFSPAGAGNSFPTPAGGFPWRFPGGVFPGNLDPGFAHRGVKSGRPFPVPLGGHHAERIGSSAAPGVVPGETAPGTAGMLQHAGSMEGMHGVRDRDALKKITGRLDPARSPWCAAFAMNMLEQHGVMNLDGLKNRNYTPTIERWARDKGMYGTPDKYTPKAGDAIMFDWDRKRGETDHIGIVEKVENGYVHTIEGNAGNKVQRRKYKLQDTRIDGYVVSNPK